MRVLLAISAVFLMFTACVKGQRCSDGIISKRYLHKYGVELAEKDWESRGSDGQIISIMADGVKVTKSYVNGSLNGETFYTFPYSETAMRIETYKNGKLERVVVNASSGSPEKEEIYTDSKNSTITLWYDNGIPKSVEEVYSGKLISGEYYTRHGQMEGQVQNGSGIRVMRDRYGELLHTENIEDGKIALRTFYYSNGSPKLQTSYQNGLVHGERKQFLPSGEPEFIEKWENNKRHGITTLFQNGEKIAEIPYVNHVKDGIERRYRNGNIPVQEITWKNDSKHGPSHYYVDRVVQTDWYFHGKQVTRTAYEQMKRREFVANQ